MAPSHDDGRSTHQPVRSNLPGGVEEAFSANRKFPAAAEPAPSGKDSSTGQEEKAREYSAQDVRSPPRLQQPSTFGPPAVGTAAAAAAASHVTTAAVAEPDHGRLKATPLENEQEQCPHRLKADGLQIKEDALGVNGRGGPDRKARQEQPAVLSSLSREEYGGPANASAAPGAADGVSVTERLRLRDPSGLCSVPNKSNRSANVASHASGATTGGAQHHPHSQRDSGRAAPDSNAVRDNWGSVFVVGGGRRRRRPPVMHTIDFFLFCLFRVSHGVGFVHPVLSFFLCWVGKYCCRGKHGTFFMNSLQHSASWLVHASLRPRTRLHSILSLWRVIC